MSAMTRMSSSNNSSKALFWVLSTLRCLASLHTHKGERKAVSPYDTVMLAASDSCCSPPVASASPAQLIVLDNQTPSFVTQMPESVMHTQNATQPCLCCRTAADMHDPGRRLLTCSSSSTNTYMNARGFFRFIILLLRTSSSSSLLLPPSEDPRVAFLEPCCFCSPG